MNEEKWMAARQARIAALKHEYREEILQMQMEDRLALGPLIPKSKVRRPLRIAGTTAIIYPSEIMAATSMGIGRKALTGMIRRGERFPDGRIYEYAEPSRPAA